MRLWPLMSRINAIEVGIGRITITASAHEQRETCPLQQAAEVARAQRKGATRGEGPAERLILGRKPSASATHAAFARRAAPRATAHPASEPAGSGSAAPGDRRPDGAKAPKPEIEQTLGR